MRDSPQNISRRRYLRELVAVGGTAALAACLDEQGGDSESETPRGDPDERPQRQHAWNAVLDSDDHGNIRPPEHRVLVAMDLTTDPGEDDRTNVESAFQSLESAYAYDPGGLLFTVGYTPSYFERIGAESPIPEPTALTNIEDPALDSFDALVHLASDNPEVVLEAEEALFGEVQTPNGVEMTATLAEVFHRTEPRRTGFVGAGLPAEKAEQIGGVSDEMPDEAPFFMGFKSGFMESQASEDRVTIQDGPYAGGTTTHIESLNLQLHAWFEQDNHYQRVAQLFSPEHASEELVGEMGEKLGAATGVSDGPAQQTEEDARTEGVVGHAQKAARARDEDGTPPLLRRDFNTIDHDRPGVHFLSHQRRVADFVRTRQAMAGEDLAGEGIGQRLNNGILQYIFVRRRGNFLVPPREKRALPGL
jgi:dye decolorizing peroxidase